jgi:hypothetical protein
MSKKWRIIIAVLAAVVLLTVGTASVAMADEPASTSNATTGFPSLLARVATILGITEDELTSAFNQAREEMREEHQATENCTPRHGWGERFGTDNATDNGTPRCDWSERLRERVHNKIQKWQDKEGRMLDRFQNRGMAGQSSVVTDSGDGLEYSQTYY